MRNKTINLAIFEFLAARNEEQGPPAASAQLRLPTQPHELLGFLRLPGAVLGQINFASLFIFIYFI